MRVGLLGGTFDPVHAGHLAMALGAAAAARLERVLLVPCAVPPHKARPDLTDPLHRFAMLSLLVPHHPVLAVSSLEIRRGGASYTVETLRALQARRPGDDLFLIVGSDSWAEMPQWRESAEILRRAAVAVVVRPGFGEDRLRAGLPPEMASILREGGAPIPDPIGPALPFAFLVQGDPVDVASTEIRRRVREGREIGGMVPAPVEAYIRRQGLYGPSPVD